MTVCDFFIAWLDWTQAIPWLRKAWVVLSLFINLGLLCYFKYTNFLGETFASLTGGTFTTMDIFLPVGILGRAVVELYDRCVPSPDNANFLGSLLDYAFFLSFPSWWRGLLGYVPVISFRKSAVRCLSPGRCSDVESSSSLQVGSSKRLYRTISALTLWSVFLILLFIRGGESDGCLWLYLCRFIATSPVTVIWLSAFALVAGLHFNINFDSPYKSASITEFWRRWHISLSSWLRDYLYISLGQPEGGKSPISNLIITMFLGGLWHGASWNFVLWE